jgi:hypothetical protein
MWVMGIVMIVEVVILDVSIDIWHVCYGRLYA